MAVWGLASTSTFTTSTEPAYFSASLSISGATSRQGPHQAAQKSTITGLSFWMTSSSKLASVASRTFDIGLWLILSASTLAGDLLEESVHLEDLWVGEAIEDGAPFPAGRDDAGGAQHGQVLAHVRHLAADVAGQVADRTLAVGQPLHDAQSLRVGQRLRDCRRPIAEPILVRVASIGPHDLI